MIDRRTATVKSRSRTVPAETRSGRISEHKNQPGRKVFSPPYKVALCGSSHVCEVLQLLHLEELKGNIVLCGLLQAPELSKTEPVKNSQGEKLPELVSAEVSGQELDFIVVCNDEPFMLARERFIAEFKLLHFAQLLSYRHLLISGFDFTIYARMMLSPIYELDHPGHDLARPLRRFILECQFICGTGYNLELDAPRSLNEKIQYLKHNCHLPLITRCSDKYGVRGYLEEVLGKDEAARHLPGLLGVWDSAEDIDFDTLPDKFALKVTHGNAQNILCPDKTKLNVEAARAQLTRWLRPDHNHYYPGLEWCYKDIPPRILGEEYLQLGDDLPDYKFFCMNGEPKLMYVAQNRRGQGGTWMDFFDLDFNHLPFTRLYPNAPVRPQRPAHWEEMIELSRRLAAPFALVRVDFYSLPERLLIGELTFDPGNGTEYFEPVEWDFRIGELLDLSTVPSLDTSASVGK